MTSKDPSEARAISTKRRRTDDASASTVLEGPPQELVVIRQRTDDMDIPDAARVAELLFRERTRLNLSINPALISRLENRRELGYCVNPANRDLQFVTYDLIVTEFRRSVTNLLTSVLTARFHDRSNLRPSEITTEIARIVPLTVHACMCAVYAKLRQIHRTHGRLSTRYATPPHYNKEIELPLPLAIAIQELGMFQTESLTQNYIMAPTYPEATRYEGREVDDFNITNYQSCIPIFKDLGIPCKSVDPNIKKGSAWWTFLVSNTEGTCDLCCQIPPTCYTDLAVTVRALFLSKDTTTDNTPELFTWNAETPNYGTLLREAPSTINVRAFFALCHGPKDEWSNGYA